MPVKKDTETNEGEGVLSKRVSRRVWEADFVYQGRPRDRGSSKKKMAKGRRSQDPFLGRLVKIELDAVQALADFSRLAHMPSKHSANDLKWSAKRRRSRRSYEASDVKVEPHDTHVSTNNRIPLGDSQRSELDSLTSLSQGDKASPPLDSRAESPSSPLPKLACRTLVIDGGLSSKSAFQRVIPAELIQKPSLTFIKAEMEDLQSESLPPARQKPRTTKTSLSLCPVKTELLGDQEEGYKDTKGGEPMALANLASQFVPLSHEEGQVVLNKSKAGLSEEDKEARRLRRVQANRESARQTIRKKQILCEELRQKAASLASENEGMKQKRETLMQELYFLKGQNNHLKTELEMGSSCKLEPGMLQPSQGIPVSSPAWQAHSLPCTGFPSHLYGWPRMMVQGGVANCRDWPNKIESLEEHSRNLATDPSMQPLSNALIVPGIPVNSPICSTGVAEQKCTQMSKDISSLVPTSSPHDESAAGDAETLKSAGASCDVDSATSNALHGPERDADVVSLTKPESGNPMQRRGTLCRPTAVVPIRGDSCLGERQSESRASENTETHIGLPVAQPVTCGSSCTGSISSMPVNGFGIADLYAWRTTQRTALVAAEARKRRMELTRKKRSCSKRSKLVV